MHWTIPLPEIPLPNSDGTPTAVRKRIKFLDCDADSRHPNKLTDCFGPKAYSLEKFDKS